MLCYVVSVLLMILGALSMIILTEKGKGFEALCVIIFLLIPGVIIMSIYTMNPINDGIVACQTLNRGAYSSIEEIDSLVSDINEANRFLRKAKTNAHPFWNGKYYEKYQKYDYIRVSSKTMQEITERAKLYLVVPSA